MFVRRLPISNGAAWLILGFDDGRAWLWGRCPNCRGAGYLLRFGERVSKTWPELEAWLAKMPDVSEARARGCVRGAIEADAISGEL